VSFDVGISRDLHRAAEDLVAAACAEGVPAALAGKDARLWGPDAEPEAAHRLGWLDCPQVSGPLPERAAAIRAQVRESGAARVLLAGMGGSSLAPEVIAAAYGVPLTVLDSTDPAQVAAAAGSVTDLVAVVSSKSGGTLETDSHRRYLHERFQEAGVDPRERIVVVTDPGSPLEKLAGELGYRHVVTADPDVGGRYSALTAFGLVPTALAGVPVGELLESAAAFRPSLAQPGDGNPALRLGAVLGAGWQQGRDKLFLAEAGASGFGSWAEQLVAESTGKQGRGLLPVVVEGIEFAGEGADRNVVLIEKGGSDGGSATRAGGELGASFLAWEYAVAYAGRVIAINPFDQPNVAESKDNTARVLEQAAGGELPVGEPSFVDGAIEVRASAELLGGARDLRAALDALLGAVADRGYLAVMAYLDRTGETEAAQLRTALAGLTPAAVTFGWGPRFLHSTGQYHKGGPQNGAFLQVTGAIAREVAIPGREFGFGRLQLAQALGDREALRTRGRPLLHLHLRERADGLAQLLAAAGS
jgi:glucose-6-phosphate isomerase